MPDKGIIGSIEPARTRRFGLAMAVLGLVGLLGGGLAGCSGAIDRVRTQFSPPQGVPERPPEPGAFPAVNDIPPPLTERALSAEEQAALQRDLVAARDRQTVEAGTARQRP